MYLRNIVSALGISVTNISLPTKKVTLKGMNGLKNGVTIQSFDLPANDPAGGIHLTLQTTVANVRIYVAVLCLTKLNWVLTAVTNWRFAAQLRVQCVLRDDWPWPYRVHRSS
jgi:hypothetical protein